MKREPILIVAAIIVAVGILAWGAWFLWDTYSYSSTEGIVIENIIITSDSLAFNVSKPATSAEAFHAYKYEVKDGTLYIKIRYGFITKKHPIDSARISIKGDFLKITRIYLKGAPDDLKLVWENGNPIK